MSAQLPVHVSPKSGRDEVVGWRDRELQVRVTVPPEAGKANIAACVLLAKAAGVPRTSVRVLRGESSRHKLLEFTSLEETQLRAVFGEPEG